MLVLSLVLFALILFLTFVSYRPPAPKPADVPPSEFSGTRAREVLYKLVGDGVPHPVGSTGNAAVREQIVAILTQFGYNPEIQTGFTCNEFGVCAALHNVLARLDGRQAAPAVLLAAHYDSVPAGPGASDDGAGVAAVIEIARVLKALPPPKDPIIILIDDGEEAGLLGARAFIEGHPWAKDVRAAVNIEARGSSGPSFMFETGSANNWLVQLYSAMVPQPLAHPMTGSIYYVVYKQLPNDTDFTLFKGAGYQGFNFAYIGDVVHYHTPLDNFENADPRSLEHHGENALATLLALANTGLQNPPPGEAVFFDVFARWFVHWPTGWTPLLALVAAALLLVETVFLVRSGRLALRDFLWGFLAWLAVIVAAATLALVLLNLLKLGRAFPSEWVAHPVSAELAFWCVAFAAVFSAVKLVAGRSGYWGLWSGMWTWWTLVALVLAWREPGVSYVFVVPVALAGLCGVLVAFPRGEVGWRRDLASMVPAVAAAIVGFSLITELYAALGAKLLPGVALLVALLLTTLLPIFGEVQERYSGVLNGMLGGSLGLAIVAAIAALLMPAYSAQAPERLNIEFVQDGDTGKAQWAVEADSRRLPVSMQQAISFGSQAEKPFPWSHDPVFLADAPHVDLPAPTLTVEDLSGFGGKTTFRTQLRSQRGASIGSVLFPPSSGVEAVSINGHAVPQIAPLVLRWRNGWREYDCLTMPGAGVEVGFTLPSTTAVDVYVADETYSLPLEGLFLQKARPGTAAPSQDGDVTVVTRRVRISP